MAVPKNPLESFLWGAGGAALTPDEIARRREMEQALVAKTGIDTSPVGHWTQGLARVLGAAGGAYRRNRLDRQQGDVDDYNSTIVQSLIGGASPAAGGGAAAMPMAGASGEIAATGPVQPIDMTGNEVFSSFIDTAKAGGLTNPYGLAALAATGKAESGFDPGNVNRTWSDPSESGQAGTAGGILSWRGPRYQALAATGDLSPAGQARFFLNEDPALIAALNNAKSTEEAIGLMNNAWKFAGYDRPGGEAARRLAAAQGFLPSFQGGGEVAALTPEAAIDAVSPVGGSLADEVAEFEQTPAYSAQFPGMTQQTQQQPAGQMNTVAQALTGGQQNTSAINPAILQALADPRANAQTRQIAELLLGQQQQAQQQQAQRDNWLFQQQYTQQQQNADPLRALQLQKAQLELEAMQNPQPGYRTLSTEEKQSLGLPPTGAFQIDREGKIAQIGGGGVTVNNEGSIPAGYQANRDEQGRIVSISPIAGSPAALEAEQAQRSLATQGDRRQTSTDTITSAAANARKILSSSEGLLPSTGTVGRLASTFSETNAAELRRQIDVLKANATIENLSAMRQASPTGGALGSVTEKEGAMLASAAGAIDPDAGKAQVEKALDNYERTLLRVIHGPKVGDAIFESTRTGGETSKPDDISQEDWDFLSPEERRLFQ